MNSGPTSERIYLALKRWVLERRFRPGERLDPGRLADSLGSSVTPIRDALHMLTGEGLVETRTSEGYAIPHIDEPGLHDLYRWSAAILQLAARTAAAAPRLSPHVPEVIAAPPQDRAAALFAAIAGRTDNAECIRTVGGLNDRTAALRQVEAGLLDAIGDELEMLEASFAASDGASLVRLLGNYHRRRERAASAILRALYRAP